MIELTQEQRQEIRKCTNEPVRLTDPDTQEEYIVVKAAVYERLRRAFEEVDPSLYEFEELN